MLFVALHGSTTTERFQYLLAYKFFLTAPSCVLIHTDSTTSSSTDTLLPGFAGFAAGRTVPYAGTATNLGEIAVACGSFIIGNPTTTSVGVTAYPGHLVPRVSSSGDTASFDGGFNISSLKAAIDPVPTTFFIVHQGRIVYTTLGSSLTTVVNRVGSGVITAGSETIAYSKDNDWFSTSNFSSALYVPEQPFGVGAMASMNASELVVVKRKGGGFAVRGDLDSPTVVRIPGMTSTGTAINVPVATPMGLVYGANSGVWVWSGGDTSELISPQLDGWFWNPRTSLTYGGDTAAPYGSFGYEYPFVFAPNNWLFDERTKAWWRFGKPTVRKYAWNTSSANGRMLCGPPEIHATQPVLCDWYDPAQGASKYHARTHPLQKTRGRLCKFRRIRLVMHGRGTITVTLRGIDGATQAETFQNTSTTAPKAFSKTTRLDAQDVVVDIDAQAEDANGTYDSTAAAPTLHRVAFGFEKGATLA